MLFVPQRKHTYGSPRTVTGIDLGFCRCCSYLTGNNYGPPRTVTVIALLCFYVDDVRTSRTTQLWVSTASCRDNLILFCFTSCNTKQGNSNLTNEQRVGMQASCYEEALLAYI
jgi:hypothetical protein